ncbi:L-aminoadipate-semialdehyde dehydrogenase-phosphopantetheinyl transferase isoform X2 [Oryzias melastigma]|uniref:L-aminoadipate-semialdehyde dehydrogenase-phosphopantetheinyl transferase isoform X2 n=1 Tax=Oryzias melastigma TaxID=30732 RepID=UPI00168D1827|nr:L-aminoadipate-semialdehyde dehydrogenase-phosphopantetheinyl transferase isoform X2 [Oryzias melastigma]
MKKTILKTFSKRSSMSGALNWGCIVITIISPHCDRSWSFNISHQGDYVVLAADRGVQVGVDLMKVSMPGSSSVPEFFRIMTRQFTPHEWSVIQSAGSEREQLATFHRHWTLKESFIKAIGTGLGFNLQRVEFHLSPEPLRPGSVLRQTKMLLDEEPEEAWIFEESMLDADHHVAIAMGPPDEARSASLASWLAPPPPPPSPFTLLSFSELIASASPLTEEDPAYWESFRMKAEAPQRRREAQASA